MLIEWNLSYPKAMELKKERRAEAAEFIRSERPRRKKRTAPSKEWDHGRCAACRAIFADFDGRDVLSGVYRAIAKSRWGADYHRVCPPCIGDLHELPESVEVE